MTLGRGVIALLLLTASSAAAQELKAWKHVVIEPKGDAGFMLMVGQRDFASKHGLKIEIVPMKNGALAHKALLAGGRRLSMNKDLRDILAGARGAGTLATVVRVRGSSYRKPGARMWVDELGAVAGSVSGGCLERTIVARGRWWAEAGPVVRVFSSDADPDDDDHDDADADHDADDHPDRHADTAHDADADAAGGRARAYDDPFVRHWPRFGRPCCTAQVWEEGNGS